MMIGLSTGVAAQQLAGGGQSQQSQWHIEPIVLAEPGATGLTVLASPEMPAPPPPNVTAIPGENGEPGFIVFASAA
ncbi:hypothetical protein NHN26_16920 [Rhodovulum tesquicola]|uniref:hypothetical protein n=1 Tax=Rhodovulum tesquicola TaxID=540254 RepID=UPI002096F007|nr:hypothetical protein [Rhodovulum tesquicola]MCO8146888.1 hypothetical protein [Rhodovulum tesquicola]